MKKIKIQFFLPVFLLAGLIISIVSKAQQITNNTLFAGIAKIMITPQTPIPMSGYGMRTEPFKGIHDDLFARVIVFSDETNKVVLISADILGFTHIFWEEITKRIAKETGINKEYILLTAVHNHGGPVTRTNEKTSSEVFAYIDELMDKLIIATKEALNNMVPVSIGAGKGECRMNINRRAPDGKGGIELGRNPYAPCDHEAGVISVVDMSGNPVAIIMNWPCHGTVMGPNNYLITGDWPGAASKYLEDKVGGKFIAPVTIGASGDINPIYGPHMDFEKNNSYAFGKDAIGEDLALESQRVAKDIQTFHSGKITAIQRVIYLPRKQPDNNPQLQGKEKDSLLVRLSTVKIGNIVLTGVSGEVFNQISVKMRNQSPYSNTFMLTHCNGSSGYLVTEDAYPIAGVSGYEDKSIPKGRYETDVTRVKTGAEKALIKNLFEMINSL
jgi:neutral ceramidase